MRAAECLHAQSLSAYDRLCVSLGRFRSRSAAVARFLGRSTDRAPGRNRTYDRQIRRSRTTRHPKIEGCRPTSILTEHRLPRVIRLPAGAFQDRGFCDQSVTTGTPRPSIRRGWPLLFPATSRPSAPDPRGILDELTRRNAKLSLGGSLHDTPPTRSVGCSSTCWRWLLSSSPTLIRMRTREGMRVAKAKGRLKGKEPKLKPNRAAGRPGHRRRLADQAVVRPGGPRPPSCRNYRYR